MRLYILPISSRRTLLYAQRLNTATTTQEQSIQDKVQSRVARTWAAWEKKESGWQKKIVGYGNQAFRRIPFEEWGLKSVPPLSARRQAEETDGSNKVEVVYPESLIPTDKVAGLLETLSTERRALHKSRMIWCFVGMPISAPFALIPVIPNLPFFYLVYRAWSHWRALGGGSHLQYLLKNNLLTMRASPKLDAVYSKQQGLLPSSSAPTIPTAAAKDSVIHDGANNHTVVEGETILLSQANGKKMAQDLDLPELEIELERAIWQVDRAIQNQNEAVAKTASAAAETVKVNAEAKTIEEKKSQ